MSKPPRKRKKRNTLPATVKPHPALIENNVHEEGHCQTCGKKLNNMADPTSGDCGGDCVECMAKAGDPDCVVAVNEVKLVLHEAKLTRVNSLVPCPFCSRKGEWQSIALEGAMNSNAGCWTCDIWMPAAQWNQRMYIPLPVSGAVKRETMQYRYQDGGPRGGVAVGSKRNIFITIAATNEDELRARGVDMITLQKAIST